MAVPGGEDVYATVRFVRHRPLDESFTSSTTTI